MYVILIISHCHEHILLHKCSSSLIAIIFLPYVKVYSQKTVFYQKRQRPSWKEVSWKAEMLQCLKRYIDSTYFLATNGHKKSDLKNDMQSWLTQKNTHSWYITVTTKTKPLSLHLQYIFVLLKSSRRLKRHFIDTLLY